MINLLNFNAILPEFIFFISGMLLLIYGAFVKNKNFSNINILSLLTILIAIVSLLLVPDKTSIANNTFINNLLTKYIKLFILILTFLVVYISSNYLKRNQINFFEYPVLLLFSVLFSVSSAIVSNSHESSSMVAFSTKLFASGSVQPGISSELGN